MSKAASLLVLRNYNPGCNDRNGELQNSKSKTQKAKFENYSLEIYLSELNPFWKFAYFRRKSVL